MFRANMQLNGRKRPNKFQPYPIPFSVEWNKQIAQNSKILGSNTIQFHKSKIGERVCV